MIERTVKKFGRIDYACNAAGICIPGTSDTASAAEFEMQFQVNARGVWICQQAEINQMIKQTPLRSDDSKFESRGAIVNVASMAGLIGLPNLVGYGASKHAVIGLTKSDGMRYGANLIRINAVCPGAIQTPMLGSFASDGVEQVRQTLALKREGLPEEVAECLVWLMSHRASYVTAASFSIHGGKITIRRALSNQILTVNRYDLLDLGNLSYQLSFRSLVVYLQSTL